MLGALFASRIYIIRSLRCRLARSMSSFSPSQTEMEGRPLFLMTSHLESTKDFAEARKKQLQIVFQEMARLDKRATVVFAGDLNLRDSEVGSGDERGGVTRRPVRASVFCVLCSLCCRR